MDISILSSFRIENPIGSWPLQKHRKMNMRPCMASSHFFLSMDNEKNFYQILSLDSENVGFDEIKKAYRSMALRCHPDVCPPSRREEFTRMFVELRKAYETLSDPVSRRRYDNELHLAGLSRLNPPNDHIRRWGLTKKVWENQLYGLQRRSNERMNRKRKTAAGCV